MRYRHLLGLLALLVVLAVACSSESTDRAPALDVGEADLESDTADATRDVVSTSDATDTLDAPTPDATSEDTGSPACAELPAAPDTPVWPTPGEVYYAQLGLGGFSTGESALIVGPQGSVVAFDVGNDSHDDDIADVLSKLAAKMEANGFPARSADTIDHVVVTHYHADHADGVADLLDRVALQGRVISRGLYELTEAANLSSAEKLCLALEARPGAAVSLCSGPQPASCEASSWSGTFPATDCTGLWAGDLLDPNDGSTPSFLPLGDARLGFVGANGAMAGESYADVVGPLDAQDPNGENARSVVAVLRYGHFRMLLTGDLTGGGDGTDDVESFYAARLAQVSDIDARGVDVLHAGHHGRKTSSNAAWLQRLLPADGRSRNVVMGISTAHLNSPHPDVLERIEAQGLGDGRIWATTIPVAGDTSASVVEAGGGSIVIATVGGGDGYVVQAIDDGGQVIDSRVFASSKCDR